MVDLSPTMWVIIILGVTVLSGGLMLWSTGSKKKKREDLPQAGREDLSSSLYDAPDSFALEAAMAVRCL
jgi:hypothetical protein